MSASVPVVGPLFGTVTSKASDAVRPAGSDAVTVTVAAPRASARTVTMRPATSVSATPGSDEDAS